MAAPSRVTIFRPVSVPSDVLDGWTASAAQKPRKRSLAIAGHRTSISLEAPFWDGLKAIATEKRLSVASLVAAIDAERGEASLSSAIRLFVYEQSSAQPPARSKPLSHAAKGGASHDPVMLSQSHEEPAS
jgi:predicted DNA-binding ribbon-helix-helix protein